jgi:hypothetical protein
MRSKICHCCNTIQTIDNMYDPPDFEGRFTCLNCRSEQDRLYDQDREEFVVTQEMEDYFNEHNSDKDLPRVIVDPEDPFAN